MRIFNKGDLNKLYKPAHDSSGEDNGSVTIIGGSSLFHGAPILSLKVASRIVDMVFFATPEKSVGYIAEKIKSRLMSFIWVPWDDVEAYIEKSDAALVGPGMMRFARELKNRGTDELKNNRLDEAGKLTYDITKRLLLKFPKKRWVIDAGSLQVASPELLPKGCVITPNRKEFEMLFGERVEEQESGRVEVVRRSAIKYSCTIVLKGPETIVCSPDECVLVKGGNAGMTKGGTGDVLAGLTVSLLAKNEPFLAACTASYIEKYAADALFKKAGPNYNADDLADKIPEVLKKLRK